MSATPPGIEKILFTEEEIDRRIREDLDIFPTGIFPAGLPGTIDSVNLTDDDLVADLDVGR